MVSFVKLRGSSNDQTRPRTIKKKSCYNAYRNFNTFHEAAVNRILTDLVKACAPRWMEVRGDFMPRGGIAIHVRAEEGDTTLAPKE